jgi:hypothetical protein
MLEETHLSVGDDVDAATVKTGVQDSYNYLKILDSGFRRNDPYGVLATFCESLKYKSSSLQYPADPDFCFFIKKIP